MTELKEMTKAEQLKNLEVYKKRLGQNLSDEKDGKIQMSNTEYQCTCDTIQDLSVSIEKLKKEK